MIINARFSCYIYTFDITGHIENRSSSNSKRELFVKPNTSMYLYIVSSDLLCKEIVKITTCVEMSDNNNNRTHVYADIKALKLCIKILNNLYVIFLE